MFENLNGDFPETLEDRFKLIADTTEEDRNFFYLGAVQMFLLLFRRPLQVSIEERYQDLRAELLEHIQHTYYSGAAGEGPVKR